MLSVIYRKASAAELLGHNIGTSYSACKKIYATPSELVLLKKSELLGGIFALQVPETDSNIRVMAKELGSKFLSKDSGTIYSTFMRRVADIAKAELLN